MNCPCCSLQVNSNWMWLVDSTNWEPNVISFQQKNVSVRWLNRYMLHNIEAKLKSYHPFIYVYFMFSCSVNRWSMEAYSVYSIVTICLRDNRSLDEAIWKMLNVVLVRDSNFAMNWQWTMNAEHDITTSKKAFEIYSHECHDHCKD